MIKLTDLQKSNQYEWKISKKFRHDMRVDITIFASEKIIRRVLKDSSLEQAVNASTLPGLVGNVIVMPDMHQGYGFPIGGVAATKYPEGVISPGAIGYDINCGVRLLGSQINYQDIKPYLEELADSLYYNCPSGVGGKGHLRLSEKELDQICRKGSRWAYKNGYATEMDLSRTEEFGEIAGADPSKVSKRAKDRGRPQLGTLGGGNHFIEIDLVEKVFDDHAANIMGLIEGSIVVQIHCGSRGFGHQICSDYVKEFQNTSNKYGISHPERGLVSAPMNSPEGEAYLAAMRSAANYAFANRQVLSYYARKAFEESLAGKVPNWQLHQIYDLAHNIGKIETHQVDGEKIEVCVHRKGATRAFGPDEPSLPSEYKKIGQPVLVPGSMGTSSWVLTGTRKSMEVSFGSCCHGAGRLMSRSQAKKQINGSKLINDLKNKGIHIKAGSLNSLAEEAPQAYKDVNEVVEVVEAVGIGKVVARLTPVAVIKG